MNGFNSPEELLRWAKRADDNDLTSEQNEYAMNRFHRAAQEMGLSDEEALARWDRFLDMDRRERARATGLGGLDEREIPCTPERSGVNQAKDVLEHARQRLGRCLREDNPNSHYSGLGDLGYTPEVHAQEYRTAVEYSRQRTKSLSQSLQEALDPANGMACSDAFDEAKSLINTQYAEYIHFFAANPEAEEMPPSEGRNAAKAALKEFAQKCLIPKASPSRGPWYKRAFKRGR